MSRNLYADLDMFKRTIEGNSPLDAADATEIERRLETASRRVDEYCRRRFYAETDTRYLAGNGAPGIWIPDLLSASSIKLDEDGDRTYELTLSAGTDYYLLRKHADDEDGLPKTFLQLDVVNGQRSYFACQRRLIEIVGVWGYTQATEAVSSLLNEALDASETGIDVVDGTAYAVGQTIKIEDEAMYVQAIATNTLTVERGVNGTTAATHNTGLAISRYVYVPEVRDAALILAARTWKRRDASYANVISNEVVGTTSVFRTLDPDVEQMLAPLVRWGV